MRVQIKSLWSTRNTGQDPARTPTAGAASQCLQTGSADQIHPLDLTGNRVNTYKPPMVSTVNPFPSRNNLVPLRVSKITQGAAGDPLSQDPVHLPPTSPTGADGQVISFTIMPTEEDIRWLQTVPDKNGHIKRPPNAYFVWASIHRRALKKDASLDNITYTYQLLGSEWSKLSVEKKRPYYEVADILKYIHWQHFPDYKYRPRRKRNIERFSSKKTAGQDPGVSFSSACPQAQSMRPCPSAAPYPMCYQVYNYPYTTSCQYHQMGLCSRAQIPTSRCSTEGIKNYHNTQMTASEGPEQTNIFPSQQPLSEI